LLYTSEEKEIMSAAVQPNMRNPDIGVEPFRHIIKKYLKGAAFANKNILDIGPGQCDFLDLAKKSVRRSSDENQQQLILPRQKMPSNTIPL